MNKPELLAPVGNMDALKAAVMAGGDAVYLGGKEFNARINASNFNRDEIEEIVKYCHLFGVKVYITINILIKDKEIKEVMEYVHFLYHISVDALIVQDLGLFYLINAVFKEFSIHSSTQMFIHSLYGVKLLEEMGFERIVLARELTAKEIKHIVDRSKAEIKIFNHGAMCVCYSGQCLMSSMIGGRSGNRGKCAQPCRKYYQLWENGKKSDEGYLLSPKDLNTLDIVSSLIETGAHSYKIEGRKKSAEYVFTVVSAYRKLIDAHFEQTDIQLSQRERLDVQQVFNRKFSQGYFLKDRLTQQEYIGKDNPKKRPLDLGKIIGVKKDMAIVSLVNDITLGDGLLVKGKNGEFAETLTKLMDKEEREISSAKAGDTIIISFRKPVGKGDNLCKTVDNRISMHVKELINREYPGRLPISIEANLTIGKPFLAKASYNGLEVKWSSEDLVQKAVNRPLEVNRVEEQFSKLGNTPYTLENVSIYLEEGGIVPISQINQARRELCKELTQSLTTIPRIAVSKGSMEEALKADTNPIQIDSKKLVVKLSSLELLKEIVNSDAKEFIFGSQREFDMEEYKKACEIAKKYNKDIILSFPTVTRLDYLESLEKQIDNIMDLKPNGVLISNYELLSIFKESGCKMEADYRLNPFNRFTLYQLKDLGFQSAYLSTELNHSEIDAISKASTLELGLFVYGNMELMVSQYPIVKGEEGFLKDKLSYTFPVIKDVWGRSHVYNGKKLSLYEEIDKIKGISKFRIDLTDENLEEAIYIINGFTDKLNGKEKNYEYLTTQKAEITKGHFKRGV